MSSSAPNTQGQLTVAKLAQCLNAGLIEADVDALEAGRAVRGLDALTATRAAMPGAGFGQRRRDLALLMCHGRPLSLVDGRGFDAGDLAAVSVYPALNVAGHVNAVGVATSAVAIKPHGPGFCVGEPDVVASAGVVGARQHFGNAAIVQGNFGAGGDGLGHFQLLPLISRGAEGKQSASHELNYTHETKERMNFLKLFFGWLGETAKPSNVEFRGTAKRSFDGSPGTIESARNES